MTKQSAVIKNLLFSALLCLLTPVFANAQTHTSEHFDVDPQSPPLHTDDPDTTQRGHWEINILYSASFFGAQRALEAPLLDINTGLTEMIQAKFETPWNVIQQSGKPEMAGPGKTLAGLKIRLQKNQNEGWNYSLYPQIQWDLFHSNLVSDKILDHTTDLILPLLLSRKWKETTWGLNFGASRPLGGTTGSETSLFGSVAASHSLSSTFSGMAEFWGTRGENEKFAILNFGVMNRVDEVVDFYTSFGRSLITDAGAPPHYVALVGIKILQ